MYQQSAIPIPRVDEEPFSSSSHSPTTRSSRKLGFKKTVVKYLRQCFFVIFYFTWLYILRWVTKPEFLFLVYGTSGDKRAFWPGWLESFLKPVFPVSFLRRGNKRGWIIATPLAMEELEENNGAALKDILEHVRLLFPQAQCCALAGRLPGVLRRNGVKIKHPFVDGSVGTRNTILKAVLEAANELDRRPEDLTVAVLGGSGYTGTNVVKDLSIVCGVAIGIDPKHIFNPSMPTGINQRFTAIDSDVARADIVVVLTAQGNDAQTAVPYLRPGMVVLDDTHPCIKSGVRSAMIARGVKLLKVSMCDGKLRAFPRLPNFRSNDIPGCLAEAIATLLHGAEITADLKTFSEATKHDLVVKLAPHPNDS